MATAPRLGLEPARKKGSAPDNKGLNEYDLASGYATALAIGDVVKMAADGSIVVATNDADATGVFAGVRYVDTTGRIQYQKYWPAGQVSLEAPTALVLDDPSATFLAVADCPVTIAYAGKIYPLNLTAPNANVGHSTMTIDNCATQVGSYDVEGEAAITDIAGLANNDTFTVKSTVTNIVTTVTIVTGQTPAQLLSAISGNGVTASYTVDGYLQIQATDGGNLVIADGTGTPLADAPTFAGAAGTVTADVAASAGLVKVLRVADADNQVLEVVLVNSTLRDNGAN